MMQNFNKILKYRNFFLPIISLLFLSLNKKNEFEYTTFSSLSKYGEGYLVNTSVCIHNTSKDTFYIPISKNMQLTYDISSGSGVILHYANDCGVYKKVLDIDMNDYTSFYFTNYDSLFYLLPSEKVSVLFDCYFTNKVKKVKFEMDFIVGSLGRDLFLKFYESERKNFFHTFRHPKDEQFTRKIISIIKPQKAKVNRN